MLQLQRGCLLIIKFENLVSRRLVLSGDIAQFSELQLVPLLLQSNPTWCTMSQPSPVL